METKIYEPELGLDGTIEELVDWANKYTDDYSDDALKRISELAAAFKMDEKFIRIPLLLIDERKRETESEDGVGTPYERMQIDKYLFDKISYAASDGKGGETEIFSEGDKVVVSLSGVDEDGYWNASNQCDIDTFMGNEYKFLDGLIGEALYYGKQYMEE